MFFVPPFLVLKTFFFSQDFTKKNNMNTRPPHFRLHHRPLLNDDSHLHNRSRSRSISRCSTHINITTSKKNIITSIKWKLHRHPPPIEHLISKISIYELLVVNLSTTTTRIIIISSSAGIDSGNPTRTPEFVVNFYSWSNNTIMQFLLRQNHLVLWAPQKSGFDSQGRLQDSSLHGRDFNFYLQVNTTHHGTHYFIIIRKSCSLPSTS